MNQLLQDAFNVMIYGMGTVFIFLTVLVFAIIIMSSVVQRWLPEEEPIANTKTGARKSVANINPLTLKIIQAAIEQHRNR